MKSGVLPALAFLGLFSLTPLDAGAAESEKVYWLFSQAGGKTWCAFADSEEYKRAVGVQQPAETARVVTFAGEVLELEYQVTPPTGDWVVMDRYAYTDGRLTLRRTNLLLLEGLEVVQETAIVGANAAAFRVVSAKTLDGEETARQPRAYPDVPVRTAWKAFPFLDVARKLESAAVPEVCERVN